MVLIPYRRLSFHTRCTAAELTSAISGLLDGPPAWWAIFHSETVGHRLRGTVGQDGVRLIVLPKPWHRIGYLPVATGEFVSSDGETILTLSFRPKAPELVFLAMWLAFFIGIGGPLWFGLGVPVVYHVLGCFIGFEPEVNRVAAVLQSALGGGSTAAS